MDGVESAQCISGFWRDAVSVRHRRLWDSRIARRRLNLTAAIAGALFLLGHVEHIAYCYAAEAEHESTEIADAFVGVANVVEREISAGKIPGAVVLVGQHNRIVYRQAFGWRSLVPRRE